MKMKSKLFGFNAKLALAVLAVGTMFASCYDSENGDVTKPYKAPDAVYTFVGTVTNNVTGAPVADADITLSGAVDKTAKTDAQGTYQVVVKANGGLQGNVTINVAGTNDYEAASATVTVETIENGQAVTYYKNIMVNYVGYLPEGLKVTTASSLDVVDDLYSGEEGADNYVLGLDIMNKDSEPLLVKRTFIVSEGAIVTEDSQNVFGFATKSSDEVKNAICDYITNDLCKAPAKEFQSTSLPYEILIAPLSALKSVTVSYMYETKSYNFTYGNEEYTVKVQRVVKVNLSNEQTSFSHYHGHGHGHGHGDDINAGGGILTPEM